jgi:hypothetical protein
LLNEGDDEDSKSLEKMILNASNQAKQRRKPSQLSSPSQWKRNRPIRERNLDRILKNLKQTNRKSDKRPAATSVSREYSTRKNAAAAAATAAATMMRPLTPLSPLSCECNLNESVSCSSSSSLISTSLSSTSSTTTTTTTTTSNGYKPNVHNTSLASIQNEIYLTLKSLNEKSTAGGGTTGNTHALAKLATNGKMTRNNKKNLNNNKDNTMMIVSSLRKGHLGADENMNDVVVESSSSLSSSLIMLASPSPTLSPSSVKSNSSSSVDLAKRKSKSNADEIFRNKSKTWSLYNDGSSFVVIYRPN